ncbi:MAG: extracellular solute-binding protein [Propionibacteriaceae bacterium]|jgi:N,N'-diacetylchitobiose transport system substrate-binding protein|nr:extracellular solute-binding protein [Propionibacteriaceae bacterium]
MKGKLVAIALGLAAALALSGCGTQPPVTEGKGEDITLWLIGGDTPQALRDYLIHQYASVNGGKLTIEEQTWRDIVTKLTTMLPDAANTPDVTEIGNTQSPTFTNVGAFADISDMYDKLGGDKLLQSFVEVGKVDGKNYTLPYYFGSRYVFYRKDVWAAAGITEPPKTLTQFNEAVIKLTETNPNNLTDFSGLFMGGQDWRNAISWIFANGGDLAKKDGGQWKSTLSDPNTIKGLTQWQQLQQKASKAPSTARDETPWLYINDSDAIMEDGAQVGTTSLAAGSIMAPGWAHWSIGDLVRNDQGKEVRQWNDETFGVFPLPGNDGKPAPVFAGGSNIGISAKSKHQAASRQLLEIMYGSEYQTMLGQNGLGPANRDYMKSLGDDIFAKALIDSASNSKLTPAAPGWATVENSNKLEEFFEKVSKGGDITALAAEYDAIITPMLNQ